MKSVILVCTSIVVAQIAAGPASASVQAASDAAATSVKSEKSGKSRKQRRVQKVEGRKAAGQSATPASSIVGANQLDANGDGQGEILVIGLAESARAARQIKRGAKQVVDVVVAQDIGKLPDNNVPETISRLPGVEVERAFGEGSTIRVRGTVNGTQVTVNGTPVSQGLTRDANINQIPAALLAGVEVYKNATPDQPAGSLGGSVNVILRRPLDFKKSLTIAGGIKGAFNEQTNSWQPQANLLINKRYDTGIGEIGLLVNGSYSYDRYVESQRTNQWFGEVPANQAALGNGIKPNTLSVGAVGFGVWRGERKNASINVSSQWKPTPELSFIAEAMFTRATRITHDDEMNLPIIETVSDADIAKGIRRPAVLTNPAYSATSPNTLESVTVTPSGRTGIASPDGRYLDRNMLLNGFAKFENAVVKIDANIAYQRANFARDVAYPVLNFVAPGKLSYNVIFDDQANRGGLNVDFNADPLDLTQYSMEYMRDYRERINATNYTARFDVEAKVDTPLISSLKFGYFYNRRDSLKRWGDRSFSPGWFGIPAYPVAKWPETKFSKLSDNLSPKANAISLDWYKIDGDIDSTRSLIRQIALALPLPADWKAMYNTASPQFSPTDRIDGSDSSHEAYAMANLRGRIVFPFELSVGLRAQNAIVNLQGIQTRRFMVGNALVTEIRPIRAHANNLNLQPSALMTTHFTENLQLRTGVSYATRQPNTNDLNPAITLNLQNANSLTADGGNPNLKALTSWKYDASLEWYFGKASSATLAVYQIDVANDYRWFSTREVVPQVADVGEVLVRRPYSIWSYQRRGVEAATTTLFTFLPSVLKYTGFQGTVSFNTGYGRYGELPPGAVANFMSGQRVPIFDLPKWLFNAALFYDDGHLNARVAFQRKSKIFGSNNADPRYTLYQTPYNQLDFSLSYDLIDNVTLALEGQNILRSGRGWYYEVGYPRETRYWARNIYAGIRFRF